MRQFDRYVAIDWSAAATPTTGANSIWAADRSRGRPAELLNLATRADAARYLDDVLAHAEHQRTLVGIDASFGYPTATSAHFGLEGVPWRAMWAAIAELSTDDDRNRNNRFEVAARLNDMSPSGEGPFWGCPDDRHVPSLRRTKPATSDLPEFRLVEQRVRSRGSYPKSGWQLLGAGSVGGQTLTLVPILERLLDRVAIWPFTTGLQLPGTGADVVIAEIWPSWFIDDIPAGMIPDAAQVAATASALHDADVGGELADWFAPRVDDPESVCREEGWILGIR